MTQLLHTQQLAEYLHNKMSTLESWRSAGCGPPYLKIGRRVFYRLADVDAWLESRRIVPQERSTGKRLKAVQAPQTAVAAPPTKSAT
jgi:predicted DNA-binding transcriptional regulator AlpA